MTPATTTNYRQRWQLYALPSLAKHGDPWRPIPGAVGTDPDCEWNLAALPALADGLDWFDDYGTDYTDASGTTTDLDVLTLPRLVVVYPDGRVSLRADIARTTLERIAAARAAVYTITRATSYSRTSAIAPPRSVRALGEGQVQRWARAVALTAHHPEGDA
jgi:hypothetical protein